MNNLTVAKLMSLRVVSYSLITSNIVTDLEKATLNINSFLKVKGEITYNTSNDDKTSFIQLSTIEMNNVKQWRIITEDDLKEVNNKLNFNKLDVDLQDGREFEVDQMFLIDVNTNYNSVMIELSFSFLSALWNGNTAYIKVNDEIFWMDHHTWEDDQDCNGHYWHNPIRIILSKTKAGKNLKLTFGIKVNSNTNILKCPELLKQISGVAIKFENLVLSLK